jgi:predicted regulator of Ras-like GTPase activity (Roadblock/LC7/MglB family)
MSATARLRDAAGEHRRGKGAMSQLTDLLNELVNVEGINSSVVVGRDGFVIEGVTSGTSLDADAVGAVISTGIGSSEVMGRELEVGLMTQGMVEFDDGLIVMALLGEDAILAVVADLNANLGNVRFQIKKRLKSIEKAL